MTGKEIKEKRFEKAAMFGYKVEEVEQYLAAIAQLVDNMNKEKAILEKKLEILADKIEEYRRDEESMKEALLGAQRLGNSIMAEAQAKADHLVAEAEEKASTSLRQAEEKVSTLLKDAEKQAAKAVAGTKIQIEKEQKTLLKMQKEVSNFKANLLSTYKSHLDLITSLPELERNASENAADESPETAPEETSEQTVSEPENTTAEAVSPEVTEVVEGPKQAEEAATVEEDHLDPVERAKRELENTQQIAKKQMNIVNHDLEKTQQISFPNSSQRISYKSERVDVQNPFESKFGDLKFGELKFGKNNK